MGSARRSVRSSRLDSSRRRRKRRSRGWVLDRRIDNFLTDRLGPVTVFQNRTARPARGSHGAGNDARDSARNEMGVKPLKTNNSAKMVHFAPPMISRTYDGGAKRFVSLSEMNLVDFAGFPPRRGPKRKECEINGGFGTVARPCDSEMAPQAIGIAQNGLANGAPARGQGEPIRRTLSP